MHEKYYTEGQLEALASCREELGADAIERGQREWAEIFAALDAERTAGTDPADPRVQELARRGGELVAQFTGGDTEIRASLQRMYEEEGPERASRGTVDPELWAYYQAACAATAGS